MNSPLPDSIGLTYAINREDGGGRSITCLRCGTTSHHPEDVAHKYCGHCHVFHAEHVCGPDVEQSRVMLIHAAMVIKFQEREIDLLKRDRLFQMRAALFFAVLAVAESVLLFVLTQ